MGVVGLWCQLPNCGSKFVQILLQKCAKINLWDAELATRFTLFAPEGPMECQITAAVSSQDSLTTGRRFRLPFLPRILCYSHTEGRVIFPRNVHLAKSQCRRLSKFRTLPGPSGRLVRGTTTWKKDPSHLVNNHNLFAILPYAVHIYFF